MVGDPGPKGPASCMRRIGISPRRSSSKNGLSLGTTRHGRSEDGGPPFENGSDDTSTAWGRHAPGDRASAKSDRAVHHPYVSKSTSCNLQGLQGTSHSTRVGRANILKHILTHQHPAAIWLLGTAHPARAGSGGSVLRLAASGPLKGPTYLQRGFTVGGFPTAWSSASLVARSEDLPLLQRGASTLVLQNSL